MVAIEITYRPAFWPWKRTFKKLFPTAYSELSTAQFIAIANMNSGNTGDISFLSIMTGLRKNLIRKLGDFQRYKLFEIFNAFDIDKPHNGFVIQSVKAGKTVLFLPGAKLKGMSFGQFIFAQSLFETWQSSHTSTDLCRFVASICLKKGEIFSENTIGEKEKLLAATNAGTLQAIAFNWQLIGAWLGEAYPIVFSKDEPGEKVKQVNNGWLKIYDSIVGTDIVNADRYAALPVNNVFRYMTQRIKENMKRKK